MASPSLLDLPAELRNEIYEGLLHTPAYRIPLNGLYTAYDIFPAILRVNKQCHEEAAEILYSRNRFDLCTRFCQCNVRVTGARSWFTQIGTINTSRIRHVDVCLAEFVHFQPFGHIARQQKDILDSIVDMPHLRTIAFTDASMCHHRYQIYSGLFPIAPPQAMASARARYFDFAREFGSRRHHETNVPKLTVALRYENADFHTLKLGQIVEYIPNCRVREETAKDVVEMQLGHLGHFVAVHHHRATLRGNRPLPMWANPL